MRQPPRRIPFLTHYRGDNLFAEKRDIRGTKQMLREAERNSMYQMRQSGATLDQIAVHFGISRERVRQLLVKHHGSTRVGELLSTTEVRHRAGYTYNDILKLKRRGIIQPAKVVGRCRTLWKPETVDTIKGYADSRRCPVCSGPLPSNRRVYCSQACWIEGSRKLHNEQMRKWRHNHPEKVREIHRQYHASKSLERYQTSEYVVHRKVFIPLGTRLKVLGYGTTHRRFMVECGGQVIEVPVHCLKREPKESQKLGKQPINECSASQDV